MERKVLPLEKQLLFFTAQNYPLSACAALGELYSRPFYPDKHLNSDNDDCLFEGWEYYAPERIEGDLIAASKLGQIYLFLDTWTYAGVKGFKNIPIPSSVAQFITDTLRCGIELSWTPQIWDKYFNPKNYTR